jgi:single-strand DNA-binding protein
MKTLGIARLGRTAEVRYPPSGDPVANLSLAFNFGKKDESGNRLTQWIEGSFWGTRAEALSPYLLQGNQIFVELDDVHMEEYQKKDGSIGSKLVGRVSNIELISNKAAETGSKSVVHETDLPF